MSGKGKIPLRQCMGCREMKSKKELIRILRTVDGSVALDPTGRMNGRGAYICRSADCLARAVKSRSLERSLKTPIPDELYRELAGKLEAAGEGA